MIKLALPVYYIDTLRSVPEITDKLIQFIHLFTLIPWYSFLEKLIVGQLLKNLYALMEPEGSFKCSHEFTSDAHFSRCSHSHIRLVFI
jgi:hypothetical protein